MSFQSNLLLYCKQNILSSPAYYHDFDEKGRWLSKVIVNGTPFDANRATDTVEDAREAAAEVALNTLLVVVLLKTPPPFKTLPSSSPSPSPSPLLPTPPSSSPLPPTLPSPFTSTHPDPSPSLATSKEEISAVNQKDAADKEVSKIIRQGEPVFIKTEETFDKPIERSPVPPQLSRVYYSDTQTLHLESANVSQFYLLLQSRGWNPSFQYVGKKAPFAVRLNIPEFGLFTVGKKFSSKKAAKAHICWEALQLIPKNLPDPVKSSTSRSPTLSTRSLSASNGARASSDNTNVNTKGDKWFLTSFQNYCKQRGWEPPTFDCFISRASARTTWTGVVKVHNRTYSLNHSMPTKSKAKIGLAKMAMADLEHSRIELAKKTMAAYERSRTELAEKTTAVVERSRYPSYHEGEGASSSYSYNNRSFSYSRDVTRARYRY